MPAFSTKTTNDRSATSAPSTPSRSGQRRISSANSAIPATPLAAVLPALAEETGKPLAPSSIRRPAVSSASTAASLHTGVRSGHRTRKVVCLVGTGNAVDDRARARSS